MHRWLGAALEYLPSWLDLQVEQWRMPGCAVAVAHRGAVLLEHAAGHANLATGEKLAPRHCLRLGSQSKTFTAAGIMRLLDQRRLRLDDPVGQYVEGLHRHVAKRTLAQLLSHGAGLRRDGPDMVAFEGRAPFPETREFRRRLSEPPVIESDLQLKYSNTGYGLLGLVLESITGEAFFDWMSREVIGACGLKKTSPDMPADRLRLAAGHSADLLLGRRVVVRGDQRMAALAPAGGFVATAGDVARFFNQLNPVARSSILSAAARRAMVNRRWRNPGSPVESYYGLGTASGTTWGWNWFGHGGALPGYISRSVTIVELELTLSFLTNSSDGWAHPWCDGAMSILRAFATHGAPQPRLRDWSGRWWTSFSICDLVPMGRSVLVGIPSSLAPFAEAGVIEVTARDRGRVTAASGYGSFGEEVRRMRNKAGRVVEIQIGDGSSFARGRAAADLARATKVRRPSRDRRHARRTRRPRAGRAPTGSGAR